MIKDSFTFCVRLNPAVITETFVVPGHGGVVNVELSVAPILGEGKVETIGGAC